MSKQTLLSTQISRGRALLAGGGTPQAFLLSLKAWCIQAPVRGLHRVNPSLILWGDRLSHSVREAIPLGTPVTKVLGAVYPMVRLEERQWTRLQSIERQFGFQGALAMVLPWGVASLTGGIQFNLFTLAGLVLQILGLVSFYAVVRSVTKAKPDEREWLFRWLTGVWMDALSGLSLRSSIETRLQQAPSGVYRQGWLDWMRTQTTHSTRGEDSFVWNKYFQLSPDVAQFLGALLYSGAPCQEMLKEYIEQLHDERHAELDERLATVPTRVSLIFCAFLTPAVFVILMGALWPMLSDLSI